MENVANLSLLQETKYLNITSNFGLKCLQIVYKQKKSYEIFIVTL